VALIDKALTARNRLATHRELFVPCKLLACVVSLQQRIKQKKRLSSVLTRPVSQTSHLNPCALRLSPCLPRYYTSSLFPSTLDPLAVNIIITPICHIDEQTTFRRRALITPRSTRPMPHTCYACLWPSFMALFCDPPAASNLSHDGWEIFLTYMLPQMVLTPFFLLTSHSPTAATPPFRFLAHWPRVLNAPPFDWYQRYKCDISAPYSTPKLIGTLNSP
jgi:hypothetical protein